MPLSFAGFLPLVPVRSHLQLFYLISPGLEQSQDSAGTSHMCGSYDNEIDLPAVKVTLDLRNPGSIPDPQEAFAQSRKIAVTRGGCPPHGFRIAATPCRQRANRLRPLPLERDEGKQKARFALPIVQS